ncbi:hypothetical protein BOTBODRAFT_25895 [Botryobasidium botryosum FD-172 SS1]|uniref:NADH:flavin oxidoreductase/NADH oxidase N-terminal domain-containing protein n=1 Tax=Botryobasidium botryosum (strain FD-172 SS1) TaxID=930990 RepID=A0A067N0D3_BOTB1|nr:hypothetical protein BOTBODRAFT_25895 [Botryobasidium botryosum FD-172 SS1]
MCQYSSDNGHATDWHFVHTGSFATRGAGAIVIEATAVVPEGRISPEDAGLWTDSQIAPLKRIVDFVHTQGTKIGIQLAHAGRKASTRSPWVQKDLSAHDPRSSSDVAGVDENGWPDNVVGPSNIPHSPTYPKPRALTTEDIDQLVEAWVAAVKRCKTIGFDFIEIHGAHGYLLHSFNSPLSNNRTDQYGGSLENRIRLHLRIAKRVREAWGEDKPLFYRLSAVDWAEGPEQNDKGEWVQWGVQQSIVLARELHKVGVDLVDVSSGGVWAKQKIAIGPGYQIGFADEIKKAVPELLISAVGLITDPHQAERYLQEGKADVVTLARELLRYVDWPLHAAQTLGLAVKPANQYEMAWKRMLTPKESKL